MEERKEKERGEGNEICLRWDPRGFLPENFEWQGEWQEIRPVEERILLDQIGSWPDREIRDYWSAPEKLLDLGWILDKSMTLHEERYTPRQQSFFGEEEQPNPPEESLILLEFHYHTIVQNLLYNIKQCRESLEKLKKIPSEEQRAQWRRLCNEVEEVCQGKTENELAEVLSPYERDLRDMAEQIRRSEIGDGRWRPMVTAARNLLKYPVRHFMQVEYVLELHRFARKVRDVLENQLWRELPAQEVYLEKMRGRILERLQAVLSGETPEEKQQREDFRTMSVLSEYFPALFWQMMQRAVDRLCAFLCQPGTLRAKTFLEDIDRKIDAVKKQSDGISGNGKQQMPLDAYKTDGRRCVALLELDRKEQFIAFSGFWDVTDKEILCYLGRQGSKRPPIESNVLAAFKKICEAFNNKQNKSNGKSTDLVTFAYEPPKNYEIKQHMFYYALDQHLQFQPVRNMRKDIFRGIDVHSVKKGYACCERKLLAHLAATHRRAKRCTYLVVKFQPCVQCYAALKRGCWALDWDEWEGKTSRTPHLGSGVLAQLTVEYPDRVV